MFTNNNSFCQKYSYLFAEHRGRSAKAKGRGLNLLQCAGFCILFFILCTPQAIFSQQKSSGEIPKSVHSTTISGVKFYLHTVEKGQTLYAIAKVYDLNINDIVIENPEAIDGIKPGQILKVPVKKKKKNEVVSTTGINNSSNFLTHKVEQGQTLYSLAKQYKTSVEKLNELNPELKDGLKVGQTIKVSSLTAKTEPANITNTTAQTETQIPTKTNVQTASQSVNKTVTPIAKKPIPAKDTAFIMGPSDSLTAYLQLHPLKIIAPVPYPGALKPEYKIAFFLPFHAGEANDINIESINNNNEQLSNKTSIALQFYEGVILAVDSLKKQKLNAKIFVFDIDDTDSLNIDNILKKPELAKMDLLIGPLYGSSFMPIAKFAKEHSIPIVSPFTQINKILFNNPYVCKVLPSSTLQVEQMAHFVIDSFRTENIILVNNGNSKEIPFYNAFKITANKALIEKANKAADSLKEAKSVTAIESMLNPSKVNVVILPSNNQSYVTEFLSKLNVMRDKHKIVLFGLQSWVNFDNLDFEYLNNVSVHLHSNNYLNYQNPAALNFIKSYREKFKTEPELYSFQGFDITCYFISALQKYGSGFLNNLVDYKHQGIESNFNFMQYPLESGFENNFVYILKYQDNKLVKAN